MNQELRFGVIGCGGMATQVHCPNMAAIDGACTVAYCDLEEDRARNLMETHGGEYTTTDPGRILGDENLHGVLIITGPHMHPRLVQAAAAAGKHIFVEKPIAIELADALQTIEAVEAAGVKFNHGTCYRLAPMTMRAKRICPNPVYSYCQCTDSVTGQACHNIDLAVNLFHEAPLVRVYASGGQYWNLDPHLEADSFSAVLTFADGSTHTYLQHGQAYNAVLRKYHYQLFGNECCVYLADRFKHCHMMKTLDRVEQTWSFDGPDSERGPFGYMGHYEELAELVKCIREGGTCTMTIRDAAYILAVEKAILKSIKSGQVIDFTAFLTEYGADFLIESRRSS